MNKLDELLDVLADNYVPISIYKTIATLVPIVKGYDHPTSHIVTGKQIGRAHV